MMSPHCDAQVLHAPGACEYCDAHPDWQQLREIWGINFTGQNNTSKIPCPSTRRRSADDVNRWPGNRPRPQTCTRSWPHRCGINGPCNGYPKWRVVD